MDIYARVDERKDFGKDKQIAERYSKQKYEELIKKLPREQARILEQIKSNEYKELMELNTELDIRSEDDIKNKVPELLEVDKKLQSLMKYADKSQTGQTVYISSNPEDMGRRSYTYFDDVENLNKIDVNKLIEFIKQDSDYVNFNGYILASLHSQSLDISKDRICIQLQLEKGISMLHLGDGNVILYKDIAMMSRSVTVITYKGRQIINWKTVTISQKYFSEIVTAKEKELNEFVGGSLEISDFNQVKLDLKSMRTTTSINRAKDTIDYMIKYIPKEILKSTFYAESHVSGSKLQMHIQDKEFSRGLNIEGLYNVNTNTLFTYPTHPDSMAEGHVFYLI